MALVVSHDFGTAFSGHRRRDGDGTRRVIILRLPLSLVRVAPSVSLCRLLAIPVIYGPDTADLSAYPCFSQFVKNMGISRLFCKKGGYLPRDEGCIFRIGTR